EVDVVCDKYTVGKPFEYPWCQFVERGAVGYERISDAGKGLDGQRDRAVGIDKRCKAVNNPRTIMDEDSDFGDAAARRITTRGFDIHDGIFGRGGGLLHNGKYTKLISVCV